MTISTAGFAMSVMAAHREVVGARSADRDGLEIGLAPVRDRRTRASPACAAALRGDVVVDLAGRDVLLEGSKRQPAAFAAEAADRRQRLPTGELERRGA